MRYLREIADINADKVKYKGITYTCIRD